MKVFHPIKNIDQRITQRLVRAKVIHIKKTFLGQRNQQHKYKMKIQQEYKKINKLMILNQIRL